MKYLIMTMLLVSLQGQKLVKTPKKKNIRQEEQVRGSQQKKGRDASTGAASGG